MTIFSIGDLHLSSGEKPMHVFGDHWFHHFEKIARDWSGKVTPQDVVLLPGDLSWAMHLPEALEHLKGVAALPGRKILLRGNHDYWWNSVTRLREALPPDMFAIQNDALMLDGVLFAGSRGWLLPGEDTKQEDLRIYERERVRLEMSLQCARRISDTARLVCLMHFPPLTPAVPESGFTEIIEKYRADDVVYGHLHGPALRGAFSGTMRGVRYHQVSADGLDFRLYRLPECPEDPAEDVR
ncbi:MAG: metallophosphoesterase [Clostridia bacterium]|nr:metallophosphoesterase [Clostridia bacterium]